LIGNTGGLPSGCASAFIRRFEEPDLEIAKFFRNVRAETGGPQGAVRVRFAAWRGLLIQPPRTMTVPPEQNQGRDPQVAAEAGLTDADTFGVDRHTHYEISA
jgi:hypothetical protein